MGRSFWSGMLTGGILTVLGMMYFNASPEAQKQVRQMTGQVRNTGSIIGDMGGEVARVWKD
ncbi:MAG: hypothetical protein GX964_04845 [Syntrophomonadaceae bacterium]|jgi:hypothetical protein|nr:hypothetical protein [Syntrophomonadaceae bacterium]